MKDTFIGDHVIIANERVIIGYNLVTNAVFLKAVITESYRVKSLVSPTEIVLKLARL